MIDIGPGERRDITIKSRPPVDIDKQLDSIIAQACTNATEKEAKL